MPLPRTSEPPPRASPARNVLLVLEDDADYARQVIALGEQSGFEVHLVRTPFEFMKVFRILDPTMLVLDIVLGDDDVCEVIDFLVALRSPVPLIFVSSHDARVRQYVTALGRGLLIADSLAKRDGLKRLSHQLRAYRVG